MRKTLTLTGVTLTVQTYCSHLMHALAVPTYCSHLPFTLTVKLTVHTYYSH